MNDSIVNRVLERAVEIQQIPAPTFAEERRAAFVQQKFEEEGLLDVWMDDLGNVFGRLPGREGAAPVVVSAHTDTVFPLETDLRVQRAANRIAGPGIGDNALGVAGLFGLIWSLRQSETALPGDLVLIANSREEGLGDSKGMCAVVDRYADEAQAFVVLEGMALGHIFNQGASVERYRITLRTAGGHSWVDYGRPSAIHELAEIVHALNSLSIPSEPRTTLNIGRISGGTSVNSIASLAEIEIDLRSENRSALDRLASEVREIAASRSNGLVTVEIEMIGQRPPGHIPHDHPLVQLAIRSLVEQQIEVQLSVGSTDANQPLSRGLPAICIGLTTGGEAHTLSEYIDTEPLARGLRQVVTVVHQAYGLHR